jgi:hypothetical protein
VQRPVASRQSPSSIFSSIWNFQSPASQHSGAVANPRLVHESRSRSRSRFIQVSSSSSSSTRSQIQSSRGRAESHNHQAARLCSLGTPSLPVPSVCQVRSGQDRTNCSNNSRSTFHVPRPTHTYLHPPSCSAAHTSNARSFVRTHALSCRTHTPSLLPAHSSQQPAAKRIRTETKPTYLPYSIRYSPYTTVIYYGYCYLLSSATDFSVFSTTYSWLRPSLKKIPNPKP